MKMRAKPRELEHLEQVALIKWANFSLGKYPQLKWLFAVPNGGQRHVAVAAKLKAEGVKSGVPDLLLPIPAINMEYIGLAIEMKAPKTPQSPKGSVSKNQKHWHAGLELNGWKVVVCYTWIEAKEAIESYLDKH